MLIDLVNFSFFSISRWHIELDYCEFEYLHWIWTEIILTIFEIPLKYYISDSLDECEGYSIFF